MRRSRDLATGLALERIKHVQEFVEFGAQPLGAHRTVCLGIRLLTRHFSFPIPLVPCGKPFNLRNPKPTGLNTIQPLRSDAVHPEKIITIS